MKNSGINIKVTGGKAKFGDIVQGEYVKGDGTIAKYHTSVVSSFEKCLADIDLLSQQNQTRLREYENIKLQLMDLRQQITNSRPSENRSIIEKAKNIYENYGWTAKPIGEMLDSLGII